MPNWCSNGVTISHTDPAKISALADAMDAGNFLNHIIPVPEDLNRDGSATSGGPNADLYDQIRAENKAKYGYDNWYDFCVARWGTKWDVDCQGTIEISNDGHTITASFDSAWSPPCGVYETMIEDGYDVTAYYYESGMGFVGKWVNGVDDCYDYSGYDSKTVRDAIGEELDDYWCISESMAEYEEENNESDEVTEWYEEGVEKRGLEPHK